MCIRVVLVRSVAALTTAIILSPTGLRADAVSRFSSSEGVHEYCNCFMALLVAPSTKWKDGVVEHPEGEAIGVNRLSKDRVMSCSR